jgi:hypothetical protein
MHAIDKKDSTYLYQQVFDLIGENMSGSGA